MLNKRTRAFLLLGVVMTGLAVLLLLRYHGAPPTDARGPEEKPEKVPPRVVGLRGPGGDLPEDFRVSPQGASATRPALRFMTNDRKPVAGVAVTYAAIESSRKHEGVSPASGVVDLSGDVLGECCWLEAQAPDFAPLHQRFWARGTTDVVIAKGCLVSLLHEDVSKFPGQGPPSCMYRDASMLSKTVEMKGSRTDLGRIGGGSLDLLWCWPFYSHVAHFSIPETGAVEIRLPRPVLQGDGNVTFRGQNLDPDDAHITIACPSAPGLPRIDAEPNSTDGGTWTATVRHPGVYRYFASSRLGCATGEFRIDSLTDPVEVQVAWAVGSSLTLHLPDQIGEEAGAISCQLFLVPQQLVSQHYYFGTPPPSPESSKPLTAVGLTRSTWCLDGFRWPAEATRTGAILRWKGLPTGLVAFVRINSTDCIPLLVCLDLDGPAAEMTVPEPRQVRVRVANVKEEHGSLQVLTADSPRSMTVGRSEVALPEFLVGWTGTAGAAVLELRTSLGEGHVRVGNWDGRTVDMPFEPYTLVERRVRALDENGHVLRDVVVAWSDEDGRAMVRETDRDGWCSARYPDDVTCSVYCVDERYVGPTIRLTDARDADLLLAPSARLRLTYRGDGATLAVRVTQEEGGGETKGKVVRMGPISEVRHFLSDSAYDVRDRLRAGAAHVTVSELGGSERRLIDQDVDLQAGAITDLEIHDGS